MTVYEGNASSQFGFGLERFVEEAQRLAQFNGVPGITDIYDTFLANNTAYIVMEFLKGQDVKQLLAREGAIPFDRARDIVLRVCDCLAPVHAKGIIHRDISPDNIFLTDAGEVKLLDFGAARYESSVNSKSLSVILKSGYAPEEQYRSKGEQGPWTDVYALAATFYKLLTGVTPPDSMERAVRDEIKEPSKLGAVLPQGAENAIMNALNIRSADRIQSVAAFKGALGTRSVERVRAKKRRRQGGVPVPAVIALCVAAVFAAALFAFSPASPARIVSTALPEENFGTPGEGQVTIPDLAGLPEADAIAALEELGLVPETFGPVIVGGSAPGTVSSQEPMAGRFADPGGTVTLTLTAGGMQEAMDSGAIPQLVGMTAYEAAYFVTTLEQYGLESIFPRVRYEYSDTAPAGEITRFHWDEEGNDIFVFVSAGRDDGTPPFGDVRAPFVYLDNYDSGVMVTAAVASADVRPEGASYGEYNSGEFDLEISDNGSDWIRLSNYYTDSDNDYPELLTGEVVPYMGGNFAYQLDGTNSEITPVMLAGKTWRMRLAVLGNYAGDEPPDADLGYVELEQTLTIDFEGEDIRVESVETVSLDEADALVESGAVTQNDLDNWAQMREYDPEGTFTFYRFTGNFVNGERYTVSPPSGYGSQSGYCRSDGELLIQFSEGDFYEGEARTVKVNSEIRFSISPDGMEITGVTPKPDTCTLP